MTTSDFSWVKFGDYMEEMAERLFQHWQRNEALTEHGVHLLERIAQALETIAKPKVL